VIKFSEYFNDWLYGEDGYYANYKVIGKEGDFYTAVSTSKLFGGSIAKKIIDTIDSGFVGKKTTIVEIGAHHGYLIADIIQFIYTLRPKLLNSLDFAIVERFDTLKEKQKQYLEESYGDAINFTHYSDINELKLDSAIVVANEIFDAFPCELVYTKDDVLQQAFIKDGDIEFQDCKDEILLQIAKEQKITKGEIPVGFREFAKALSNNIKKFEFITFDYGDEYPRNDFSCRIYSKHKVYPFFQGKYASKDLNNQDVFEDEIDLEALYKKSDITFDVNFSYLIDCFKKEGIENTIYETQLKGLVNFGITELLDILHKNVDEKTYLSEANKVKTLLEPTGMGDRFKLVVFRKK
jgi:SAM-dependent MidA family methyltransferase